MLDQRVTPYYDLEIDVEAEECVEWLTLARCVRTYIREELLSLKTKKNRPDMLVGAQQDALFPTPSNNAEGATFSASEDYRSLRFQGKHHVTTKYQAVMIKVMHQAYMAKHPDVGAKTLLAAIENETSYVRNTFKNSPLWKTLVVCKRKGTYRLNLPNN